jgi:peptidoglycan/xylan/chitin deacetylase (PgdA/CDA1 family)
VFDRHVRWLASGRLRVVSLPQLLELADDGDALAITFDDAFTNFATDAWPRLAAAGLPATLFVPTAFVGRANTWGALPGGGMPTLPILDWPSLARLQEAGVALGAHSRTHPDLRLLGATALEEEVCGSVEDIHRETGRRPEAFAYPYGFWGAASARVVRRACRYACTTELRPLHPGVEGHALPRLDVYYLAGPARLEAFGRGTFAGYLRARSGIRALGRWVRQRGG